MSNAYVHKNLANKLKEKSGQSARYHLSFQQQKAERESKLFWGKFQLQKCLNASYSHRGVKAPLTPVPQTFSHAKYSQEALGL